MKKTTFLFFVILLIRLAGNSQELTCTDFKTGQFYIPETIEITKYKAISNNNHLEFITKCDTVIIKHIVIREGNTQIEWMKGIGKGEPDYEIIEWIDDCSYRLTYDDSKMKLDKGKRWINRNDGIVVSKTKIEGNCMFYNATLTTNKGQKITQEGIICLE